MLRDALPSETAEADENRACGHKLQRVRWTACTGQIHGPRTEISNGIPSGSTSTPAALPAHADRQRCTHPPNMLSDRFSECRHQHGPVPDADAQAQFRRAATSAPAAGCEKPMRRPFVSSSSENGCPAKPMPIVRRCPAGQVFSARRDAEHGGDEHDAGVYTSNVESG